MRIYSGFPWRCLCSLWGAQYPESSVHGCLDSISAAAQRSTRLRGCCPRLSWLWDKDLPPGLWMGCRAPGSWGHPQCCAWLWQCCPPGPLHGLGLWIPRAAASLSRLGIFHLFPFLNLFAVRFQVKCVSAHFSWEGRFTYALGSFYRSTHTAMTHLIDNVLSDG